MLTEWCASWGLFAPSYLAALLLAVLLSQLSVYIIGRRQIFLGLAVTQSSALGLAVSLWLLGICQMDSAFFANFWTQVFFSTSAGVICLLMLKGQGQFSSMGLLKDRDAMAAWFYLLGSSGSVLLLSHSPHSAEEMHAILTSSIIGSTWGNVATVAIMVGIVGLVTLYYYRDCCAFSLDIDCGLKSTPNMMRSLYPILLGASLGFSVKISGLVYTLGLLILPALCTAQLCRSLAGIYITSPLISLAVTMVGLVVSYYGDYPPGQMIIALYCMTYLAIRLLRN